MKDIASLFLTYFVRLGVPILTIPILSNCLSAEQLSMYIYMQAIVSWVVIVVEFGFSFSATRAMSKIECNVVRNNIANASNLVKAIVAASVLFAIFNFGYLYFGDVDSSALIMSMGVAFSIAFVPHSVYQTEEKLYIISKAEIAGNILMLLAILSLSFLLLLDSALQVLIVWLSIRVLILVYLFFKQSDFGYKIEIVGMRQLVKTVSNSFGAALFKLSSSLYTSGNVMILTSMLPVSDVAIFVAVDKFVRAGQGMLGPMSTVFFAKIVKGSASIKTLLICQILVASTVVFGLYVFANVIESWFYSNKFGDITSLIFLYSPVIVLIAINNTFGVNGLLADGYSKQFNIGILISALVNLVMMLILVPIFGLQGAIASILFAETFCSFYMAFYKFRIG